MIENTARYVYTVYRMKSVSAAAKELFISQPALSAAIRKAEADLGAPIFNRKTLPFSLTAEGKVYIDAVEKILGIEKSVTDRILDIHEMKGGILRVGLSTHISYYILPRVLEVFHKEYPHIEINIEITDTEKLYDLLDKETVDLIFTSTEAVGENYEATVLFEEKFVVAVNRTNPAVESLKSLSVSHDELVGGTYDRKKEIRDLSVFGKLEFIYSPPNTTIHKKRRLLFGKTDMSPFVTAKAGRQQLNFNLMQAGFGALLTTDANIATMPPEADCYYFVIDSSAVKQSFGIVRNKNNRSAVLAAFCCTAGELFLKECPLEQLRAFHQS